MTIFFVLTKLVFTFYGMDTWHPSALLIYRMSPSLYMRGVYSQELQGVKDKHGI